MGKSRQGSIDCRNCGELAANVARLSHTGQCPACGEFELEHNYWGMKDHESVPFKRWHAAHSISNVGRPPITTPPPSWIPNTAQLKVRKSYTESG